MTLNEINVLLGRSDWAWQEAIECLFAPRFVNAMVATGARDALEIIETRLIHTAIVDMDSQSVSGLSIVKIIHRYHPVLPCILLASSSEQKLLSSALALNVFSVISKPVDMAVLQDQLNRLFVKKYRSSVFEGAGSKEAGGEK